MEFIGRETLIEIVSSSLSVFSLFPKKCVPDVGGGVSRQYLPDNVALVVNLNGPLSSHCSIMRKHSNTGLALATRQQHWPLIGHIFKLFLLYERTQTEKYPDWGDKGNNVSFFNIKS